MHDNSELLACKTGYLASGCCAVVQLQCSWSRDVLVTVLVLGMAERWFVQPD